MQAISRLLLVSLLGRCRIISAAPSNQTFNRLCNRLCCRKRRSKRKGGDGSQGAGGRGAGDCLELVKMDWKKGQLGRGVENVPKKRQSILAMQGGGCLV